MVKSVLRLPEVKRLTGLSRSSIYNRIAEGEFPRGLFPRRESAGLLECEVDQWITSRADMRDNRAVEKSNE